MAEECLMDALTNNEREEILDVSVYTVSEYEHVPSTEAIVAVDPFAPQPLRLTSPGFDFKAAPIVGPIYTIPGNENPPPKFPSTGRIVIYQFSASDGSARYVLSGDRFLNRKNRLETKNYRITLLAHADQQYFFFHFSEKLLRSNSKFPVVHKLCEKEFLDRRRMGRLDMVVNLENTEEEFCAQFYRREVNSHMSFDRELEVPEIADMHEDFISVYMLKLLKKYMIMELFNQAARFEFKPKFCQSKGRLFMSAPALNIRSAVVSVLNFPTGSDPPFLRIQGKFNPNIFPDGLLLQLHFFAASNMAPMPPKFLQNPPLLYYRCTERDELHFEVYPQADFEEGLKKFYPYYNGDETLPHVPVVKGLYEDDEQATDEHRIEMHTATFDKAISDAVGEKKWLLAILQPSDLGSHMHNIWTNQLAARTIADCAVCWLVPDDTSERTKLCSIYDVGSAPAMILINPMSGQKLESWTGTINDSNVSRVLLPYLRVEPKNHMSSSTHNQSGDSMHKPT